MCCCESHRLDGISLYLVHWRESDFIVVCINAVRWGISFDNNWDAFEETEDGIKGSSLLFIVF